MIRHIVLVRFAPDVHDTERAGILAALVALQAEVPEMLAVTAGANVSAEGRSAGFTHAFTMDFADAASRDRYLAAPAHLAVASRLLRAPGGDDGIIVADIEVQTPPAVDGAHRSATAISAEAVGAGAMGAGAVGAISFGAAAMGALAIGAAAVGAFAIGRLSIGRARIRSLEIDRLAIRSLRLPDARRPSRK